MTLLLRFLGSAACAVLILPAICLGDADTELTYTASFDDGTYFTDGRLTHWHDTAAEPRINGKPLWDAGAPVRWLICNTLPRATAPEAYVEFVGGDRFPCRVQEYRHGAENWEERLPPHLLVKPLLPIDLPGKSDRLQVGIKTASLKRVVWRRQAHSSYRPGTLFFLDGREVSFRALRWSQGAVLLLLKGGTRRVAFGDIAEIHLPRTDSWDAYFSTVAELTPEGTSRLLRVNSIHGLIATTSLERFRATAFSGEPGSWYHMLQPAWSLNALWVRHVTIRERRSFLPHEVPLSLIEPAGVSRKSILGGGWNWQSDRNVRGETLRNGGKQFGWGMGVQARTELTYPLPTACKAFRCRVGLDEAAGRGGCARALVFTGAPQGRPLWASPLLVGSEQLADCGDIPLGGPAAGQKALVLVADMAHSDRPAGSDPYDIRDMVDWLEPQLVLDPVKLKAELAARHQNLIPAFADWDLTVPPEATLSVGNRIDPSRPPDQAGVRHEVVVVGGPLVASRRWTVTPEQRFLVCGVFRFGQVSEPSRIEIRINGLPVTDFQVPELTRDVQPQPYVLPLERYVGQPIDVQVIHRATNADCRVEWRSLEIASSTTPTPWSPLEIVELKSRSGTRLELQYDGTIAAIGDPPGTETYTVVGDTTLQGITALRLDAIPDARYPRHGVGRQRDGVLELHEVKLSAAPIDHPNQALEVPLDHAWSDHELDAEHSARNTIDANGETSWTSWPLPSQPHALLFGPRHDIGVPGGTRLTVTLSFQGVQSSAGRFCLSVGSQPRPVPLELHANVLPYRYAGQTRILFDEDEAWMAVLQGEAPMAPTADAYSGRMALKVGSGRRFSERLPDVEIPIRMKPGPGEARYLRWAWKKQGGQTIVMEIAHDHQWGPVAERSFRYRAGPGPEYGGRATLVDRQLPTDWTVVTRDLAAELGEFTLTGFGFAPHDGDFGTFDSLLLAPTLEDLNAATPVEKKP